jgi:hypothetical protein
MQKRNVDDTATHFAPTIWRGTVHQDEAENENEHYSNMNILWLNLDMGSYQIFWIERKKY